MGRKRNQGKARRAAKVKAREEAEAVDDQPANSSEQSLSALMRQLQIDEQKCRHGLFDPSISTDITQFVNAFHSSFREILLCGDRTLSQCLVDAKIATKDEFAALWNDSTKMEIAMSFYLCMGTQAMLDNIYNVARESAAIARYFEQFIAVVFKQSQALMTWPKIGQTYYGDEHTLMKFFRHRILCSCLDEKYEDVKHIPKMGHCYNLQCKLPKRMTERSKTKYCSRCRCITYCSRECQEAHWTVHKTSCDVCAATIAKFEAKQQNM